MYVNITNLIYKNHFSATCKFAKCVKSQTLGNKIITHRQIIHKLFVTIVLSCSIVDVISEKEYIDLKQNLTRIIYPHETSVTTASIFMTKFVLIICFFDSY